ncbi:TetR/AcrR family transcriptional regulator [Streptosporangium sp. NBC_01639]|uniref:TetR/AcrR family transcriptional regulator n=1 Tax=unclassified Streptosporangium TaxID=2632669 RepID=UPI002DD9FB00|nr:helix-turn-helix domain-containing protein [Streptosporangium sp. NBC_01756]WSC84697.1 TetR/AcrR family transcriptional regulator [Streptosporangium sp. NBC_01756]WTD56670.1 TetR/AcrR family transcriptional regulator [Streptosporangium sp. NBC_01639]
MKPQARKAGRPPKDVAHHLERAHRILDAATDLILRWGYDKTTIEDIARRAGVAKGTIYLHWRTREELFAALLRRERVEMLDEVRRRVEESPGTLRDLLGLLAFEIVNRPLVRAVLLGDSEVLGKLTRMKRDGAGIGLRDGFETYLGALLRHGALRTDLSPAEHVTALVSVLYGFLLVPQMMPEEYRPSNERLVELLADAGSRTMETDGPMTAENARAIARATLDFVDFAVERAQQKLRASLGSEENVK